MRIAMIGAGAVGQFVGGRLAQSGHEVILVARPPSLEALRSGTLILEDDHRVDRVSGFTTCAALTDLPEAQRVPDLAIVTAKSYDTHSIIDALSAFRRNPPVVMSLQNGVGNEEALASAFGRERLLAGSLTVAVTLPQPGRVRAASKGGIGIAAAGGGADPAPVAQMLAKAGFTVRTYGDYRSMKWSKLLLNMLGNSTCAILDMPPEAVFSNPGLYHIEVEAIREAVGVMMNHHMKVVPLPGYPVPLMVFLLLMLPEALSRWFMVRRIADGRGGKAPSLQSDLSKGRKQSEMEVMNGAVVRYGKEQGVAAPVNETLTRLLRGIVEGGVPWDRFRGKPDALLEILKKAS